MIHHLDDLFLHFMERNIIIELYTDTIYGYYIDPAWDAIGSENALYKNLIRQL